MEDPISVIVVEDDALIRMVAVESLRNQGFQVSEAGHAAGALVLLHSYAAYVHVLLTDITMPGEMDGLGLAHHTSRNWPWIGILIVSGRPRPLYALMPARCRFLAKPYDHRVLHGHVRALAAAA